MTHNDPATVRHPDPHPSEPLAARPVWQSITEENERAERAARRAFRAALAVAVAVHVALLAWQLPRFLDAQPQQAEEKPTVYRLQQVKLKPPEPRPQVEQERKPPNPEAKQIPVPEREIDIVEPTEETPPEPPEIDLSDLDAAFEIPDGPPSEPMPAGPILVGGDVRAPVKLHGDDPAYTRAARAARLEGTVVVQAIIDKQGNVTAVKLLQGQPMGLGDRALAAVRDWKFRPATLHGKPVDVYYNLTVNFQLS